VKPPKTSYAKSGDINIAYQVHGEGPIDLIVVPGFISHLELKWEFPPYVNGMERLGKFARIINFDKRGTGLSDRVSDPPPLEVRMDDVRAVMDAVDSEKAVLFGFSEGVALSLLFAATYPDRATALILYGGLAKGMESADYPWAPRKETFDQEALDLLISEWGDGAMGEIFVPSAIDMPGAREWGGKFERMSTSPGGLKALYQMFAETDVRHVLPLIEQPTLIMHRKGDRPRTRPDARHRSVHRHRRLNQEGRRTRRPEVARCTRSPRTNHEKSFGTLPRPRSEDDRGWLPCHIRRPRPGHTFRPRGERRAAFGWHRYPRRPPHR
jgi:pimeloyl-ACP methyl ester carboxylesterase